MHMYRINLAAMSKEIGKIAILYLDDSLNQRRLEASI